MMLEPRVSLPKCASSHFALLALVLAGCAPITPRYNIAVKVADKRLPFELAEIDHAVDALDAAFADAGLLPPKTTARIIAGQWLTLEWEGDHFQCGGIEVSGCTNCSWVDVWQRSDCIANTALTHELTHVVLGATQRVPAMVYGHAAMISDPDAGHVMVDWWQAQGAADAALRKECK
jgi:hypothetical protein